MRKIDKKIYDAKMGKKFLEMDLYNTFEQVQFEALVEKVRVLAQLSLIIDELQTAKKEDLEDMTKRMEKLVNELTEFPGGC